MMDASQVFIFGSFSEDEASFFQKDIVEEDTKLFKQNDLLFGSFDSQVECLQKNPEISSKQACNGEVKVSDHLRSNVKSHIPNDQENLVSNRGRTGEQSTKKQAVSGSCDTKANGGDTYSMKLESSGECTIVENGAGKMTDRTKSLQEFLVESSSSLVGSDTIQRLDSLSLESIDSVEESMEYPSLMSENIPMSWAAKFGGKEGNGQVAYSHGGDKSRKKSGVVSTIPKLSQGKSSTSLIENVGSISASGMGVMMKRWQPRGLKNAGNLCFLNATLQALLSCAPFFQLLQILRSRDIPEVGYPTLRAFVQFLDEIQEEKPADSVLERNEQEIGWLESGKPFYPTMFDPVLKLFSPDQPLSSLGRPRQEDAQEFLLFVMDRMHGELLQLDGSNSSMITVSGDDDWETVGPKNRSAVTRTQSFMDSALSGIFGGQLRSVVKSRGNRASATIQPFMLLHLDIFPEAVRTVEDALRLFASPESVEGYRASTGKEGIVSASKSVKLQTLSKVLILHLMRFSYGSKGTSKLHKPVRFNTEIALGRELLVSPTTEGRRYELVATITHHGWDPSRGHYTADAKYSDGRWLQFDDATVSVVGLNKVLHDQAYVLFYKQI
ncbi:ubiquitin carboxyl-terminal hydrolase 24 isoform X2 [Cryptomeria japonica]|uniref:ubiquitin carboxyl-terminal hydrolase 24 isoform X2 n=1 Tax=Cryptomeria japonica TaxID=3369 RepID=UPI0025AB975A|nr:ubiquitin carboxyl-terminal hydrolase 24 isoform X2 [Cryptomeria japonica]